MDKLSMWTSGFAAAAALVAALSGGYAMLAACTFFSVLNLWFGVGPLKKKTVIVNIQPISVDGVVEALEKNRDKINDIIASSRGGK